MQKPVAGLKVRISRVLKLVDSGITQTERDLLEIIKFKMENGHKVSIPEASKKQMRWVKDIVEREIPKPIEIVSETWRLRKEKKIANRKKKSTDIQSKVDNAMRKQFSANRKNAVKCEGSAHKVRL